MGDALVDRPTSADESPSPAASTAKVMAASLMGRTWIEVRTRHRVRARGPELAAKASHLQVTRQGITGALQSIRDRVAPEVRGRVADYIPELYRADPSWFGIALVSMEGHRYQVGEAERHFTLQSVSKPFVYALALSDLGLENVIAHVGAEPSGEAFNAISLEPGTGRPANAMINAGALVTTSLVRAGDPTEQFERIRAYLSAFAGRELFVDEAVFASEMETGDRNRALAYLMRSAGSLRGRVDETVEVYFRQCALTATTGDLAVMAATLANGGVNPCTGERVAEDRIAGHVLSVMATCGMYDFSGEWLLRVGLPSKSGVSGALIASSPGQFGIGVFSPPLDDNGNSVRGIEVLRELASRYELHLMHNPGRSAPSVYLSTTASARPSRQARRRAERTALKQHGHRIAIIAVQGDLEFAAAETLLFSIDHALLRRSPDRPRWLVLDLLKVTRVQPFAASMLDACLADLLGRGIVVAVVVQSGRHVIATATAEFCEEDEAIGWCEDALLERYGRRRRTNVRLLLEDHDVLTGLDPETLRVVAERLLPRSVAAGKQVLDRAADVMFLILSGRVTVGSPDADATRLERAMPGTAVAGLTLRGVVGDTGPAIADVPTTGLVLTWPALIELEREYPAAAARLRSHLFELSG